MTGKAYLTSVFIGLFPFHPGLDNSLWLLDLAVRNLDLGVTPSAAHRVENMLLVMSWSFASARRLESDISAFTRAI